MDLKTVIARQAEHCDSFYLYDENRILQDTGRLKRSFPQVEFLYSIKCNPNPHVVRSIFGQGFGADAASLGEVLLAGEAGLAREKVFFSAPGKTLSDLRAALPRAVVIADSLGELALLNQAAEEAGKPVSIGVRVNPDFSFSGGPGQSSKFGVDEEALYDFLGAASLPHLRITGLHVHLRSQELQAPALAAYYENMLALAERFQRACGCELEYVNMGSGMGIPFSPQDRPLDVEALSHAVGQRLDAFRKAHPRTKLLIEVGRYAAGKSGVYVTKVLDRKVSRGTTYLILKNTLNGFARPSVARMVCHFSQEADPAPWEPLFTCRDAFEIFTLKDEPPCEKVTLVGNLCTATDVIAENLDLPRLEPGDVLVLTNAGAYAAVMTPMQFASQQPPEELFLTAEGQLLK